MLGLMYFECTWNARHDAPDSCSAAATTATRYITATKYITEAHSFCVQAQAHKHQAHRLWPHASLRGLYAVCDTSCFRPQPSFSFGTPCVSGQMSERVMARHCRDLHRGGTLDTNARLTTLKTASCA